MTIFIDIHLLSVIIGCKKNMQHSMAWGAMLQDIVPFTILLLAVCFLRTGGNDDTKTRINKTVSDALQTGNQNEIV